MIDECVQLEIVRLYTEEKLSMLQIAHRLGFSASKVLYYLDKKSVERRSVSDAITNVYQTSFGKVPFLCKEMLTQEEKYLKIAGIMLYWGEGAKSHGSVKFANSDPDMIKVFLLFLRQICGIHEDRLKALVHVYPDLDIGELEQFWSHVTDIPRARFYKAHVHKGKVGTYKNKSIYGTLALQYGDTKLLQLIMSWVDEYRKQEFCHLSSAGRAIAL